MIQKSVVTRFLNWFAILQVVTALFALLVLAKSILDCESKQHLGLGYFGRRNSDLS
jgi:hypothetical protein